MVNVTFCTRMEDFVSFIRYISRKELIPCA